jgi:hypothetical protein
MQRFLLPWPTQPERQPSSGIAIDEALDQNRAVVYPVGFLSGTTSAPCREPRLY